MYATKFRPVSPKVCVLMYHFDFFFSVNGLMQVVVIVFFFFFFFFFSKYDYKKQCHFNVMTYSCKVKKQR